ncbi:alpha-2-macroglobulin family protein, partial [Prevotella conceptionensis]|uniref:alpha-2-macroglobulin family protein n=1 Tax=Prevotella conceptionensis TaxID=340486 RepID=UPI0005C5D43F
KHPDGKPANAQLMATLYDKSLDQIVNHRWGFDLGYSFPVPYAVWQWAWSLRSYEVYSRNPLRSLPVNSLGFYRFDTSCFDWAYYFTSMFGLKGADRLEEVVVTGYSKKSSLTGSIRVRGLSSVSAKETRASAVAYEEVKTKDVEETPEAKPESSSTDKPTIRENLNETAFFYPSLTSDANGDVAIKFTLPESVTTWRFMGLATDQDMNNVMVENEAVATKKMMVQPNMPRFMRLGDKGWITARVINTSEKALTGTALIEIVDPETGKTFHTETKTCTVNVGQTTNVSFPLNLQEGTKFYTAGVRVWICRISVTGKGFSDGEQHYLPLLGDTELVTNSKAFTQHRPGTLNIDLRKLFAVNRADNRLTVEYTNNPAWMMVQTLPYMSSVDETDAISLATSFYVNSLGSYLLKQAPVIKSTVELWKQENNGEGSMVSELEKNEELKTLVLNETPWVWNGKNETRQRQELTRFFDENGIAYRLNQATNKLRALQRGDGSWSWFPGMAGSSYVTLTVAEMVTRLQTLTGGRTDMNRNLERAFAFMGKRVADEVAAMKKREQRGEKNVRPSEWAVRYLYVSS